MLNKVFVTGRLGADPDFRRTTSGCPVAAFSLAVERDYKNKETGARDIDWIDITAWQALAEFSRRYLTKGRAVTVEGRIEVQNWEDANRVKRRDYRISAERIYFADGKKEGAGNDQEAV